MGKCASCGSFILMGGINYEGALYCNQTCVQNGQVAGFAAQLPAAAVDRNTDALFRSNCLICGGPGPNDVRKYYQVWSMLVLTRWSSGQQISCRSCGIKRQLGAFAFSLVCGWWGFPWGLGLTPLQLTRNIIAMCSDSGRNGPSADLKRVVQLDMAYKSLAQQRTSNPSSLISR